MTKSGIWTRSDTERPLKLRQDPSVGVMRILYYITLENCRDTRPASFWFHHDGVAGCPENYNAVFSSNKRDSRAVSRERRYRFHKYGLWQISDLPGNVYHSFFARVLILVLFQQKVPLLRMLEQDKGAKALFIYPTKVSFQFTRCFERSSSPLRHWLRTRRHLLNSC